MALVNFEGLPARDQALVAVAVLLDGREAANYLEHDEKQGAKLRLAAEELAAVAPELRMPLVGTLLRVAIRELEL